MFRRLSRVPRACLKFCSRARNLVSGQDKNTGDYSGLLNDNLRYARSKCLSGNMVLGTDLVANAGDIKSSS